VAWFDSSVVYGYFWGVSDRVLESVKHTQNKNGEWLIIYKGCEKPRFLENGLRRKKGIICGGENSLRASLFSPPR